MKLKLAFKRPFNINSNIHNPLFDGFNVNLICTKIGSTVVGKAFRNLGLHAILPILN